MLLVAEVVRGAGSTKIMGVTTGRSGCWQQDMLQEAMAGMSWPQSMACSVAAGEGDG